MFHTRISPVFTTGNVLSIRVTTASIAQVFPARSSKVKVNVLLAVKRCHVTLSPVMLSLNHVSIATTVPLVRLHDIGVYSILAVGLIVSCTITVLDSFPVFPAWSMYIYSMLYDPIVPVSIVPLMILTSPVPSALSLRVAPSSV